MKKSVLITAALVTIFLLAILGSVVIAHDMQAPEAPDSWVWGPTTSVSQVLAGCCDDDVVVVQGLITHVTNASWNEWSFTGSGGGIITLDFEDEIPTSAIITTNTVRIIGKVKNNNKIDVFGEQVLTPLPPGISPNATVAQVNAGTSPEEVSLQGQFGAKQTNPGGWDWMWFNFSDGTGTVIGDLENDLIESQIPQNRTLMFYGEVDDYFGQTKVNARLMLVYEEDPGPTATATNTPVGPTATATNTPVGPTATATARPPTSTPDPDVDPSVFLPMMPKSAKSAPPPAPTATPGPTDWLWGPVTNVGQINGGCCNDQVVVIEGQIGSRTYIPWNEWDFSDSTGTITLDFEDEIPTSAIPTGTTIRIIGKSQFGQGGGQGGTYRKIDVWGLQTMGNVSASANATVQQVNSGSLDGQYVAVEGKFGNLDTSQPGWNWYDYSDNADTTTADLENDLSDNQVPKGITLLLYGQVNDFFGQTKKINAQLMLFAANIP